MGWSPVRQDVSIDRGDTRPATIWFRAILLVCLAAANGTQILPRMPISEAAEGLTRSVRGPYRSASGRPLNCADNRAAAAENLEAFKRRLRLLGCSTV